MQRHALLRVRRRLVNAAADQNCGEMGVGRASGIWLFLWAMGCHRKPEQGNTAKSVAAQRSWHGTREKSSPRRTFHTFLLARRRSQGNWGAAGAVPQVAVCTRQHQHLCTASEQAQREAGAAEGRSGSWHCAAMRSWAG